MRVSTNETVALFQKIRQLSRFKQYLETGDRVRITTH